MRKVKQRSRSVATCFLKKITSIRKKRKEIETSSNSSSIIARFDFTLEYLERLGKDDFGGLYVDLQWLKVDVRLMKTLFLCARNRRSNHFSYLECACKESSCGSLGCNIAFRIKELVFRNTRDLQSAFLTSGYGGADFVASIFRNNIRGLWTDTGEELCRILLDEHCLVGVPDVGQLMDLIDSLLDLADALCRHLGFEKIDFDICEALEEKLMLLKNFMSFFTVHCVERVHLMEVLVAVEFVAVKAARLFYMFWYSGADFRVGSRAYLSEISQLLEKLFKPPDLQVRETCIHALTVLKLSISSSDIPLTLGKNWQRLAADFLNSLLNNLWDLLRSHATGFIISVKVQMQKIYQLVQFLRYLLREHQEKFDKLPDKMKDLIRIVVCDVGIVICSLSPDEMKKGLARETNNALFHLLEVLRFIIAEVSQFYPSVSFPRTNELGSIDFLLKNIKELASCETDSVASLKDHIQRVQEDLEFLRSFLRIIAEQRSQNDRLQILWNRVMEVAYKAEIVIDSVMVGDKPDCSSMPLGTITEEIKFLKIEAHETYYSMRHNSQPQRVTKDFIRMPSQVSTPALNEFLVDLDDEVNAIINRLERGSKYLDIVSIVGMPGLGKTSIANKVYHNPLIMHHFHIRAWCTVSQVHSKHSLLLQILHDILSPDKLLNKTEDKLAELLYKCLKGNRYLIILDDMWEIDAWNSLKESFPDDANGSRILFTSRLQIKLDSKPHYLRHFTDKESCALLQNKLFGKEGCPPALSAVVMQIAKNCKGLPLTVAIVAGILATIEQDCWEKVANSLCSSTITGIEHCMKTLELSYNHLPEYLKPCLLYFGAFQEDQDIPVQTLIMLWISEGFVQKTEVKKLEEVADEYLMDLIGRSLVIVAHQRSIGGVKACRIHDLLHEFCVAKAKEEGFLQNFHGYNEIFTLCRTYHPHRLCVYSTEDFIKSKLFFPHLRSLLFLDQRSWSLSRDHLFFIFLRFKLLRVLDFGDVSFAKHFPRELVLLVHLRYLAIACESIPPSVSNLSLLETFILRNCSSDVDLPKTIWKMKKLRHLCITSAFFGGLAVGFRFPIDNLEAFSDLHNLDTFTLAIDPSSHSIQKIMRKLPSIRRLKCVCVKSDLSAYNCKGIVVLNYLSRLESLRVDGFYGTECAFPLNLKKLTLSHCSQPWSEISTIRKLPNLEVLKLLVKSFVGETWEMKEGEFPKLRFLKLELLDIVRWTASCDNFPRLQNLVLNHCWSLEEVPSCLGDIATIKMIEVGWCHKSAISLVKQIHEEQMEMGNEDLKIIIHDEDLMCTFFSTESRRFPHLPFGSREPCMSIDAGNLQWGIDADQDSTL